MLSALFLWQVVVHRRVRRAERWEGALAGLAREGQLRLARDWDGLDDALPPAERAPDSPSADHPYARDLDVTGRASLLRLMGPVTSIHGRETLREWLLTDGTPEEATQRHGAVRELAGMAAERARFTALGRVHGPETLRGLGPFLEWAEGPAWRGSSTGVRLATWVLPPLLLAGIAGSVLLALPPFWAFPALGQIVLLMRLAPSTRDVFARCVLGGAPLRAMVPQLRLLATLQWRDAALRSVAERLGHGAEAAHRSLARLSGLLDTVESRRNMFYALVAPVLLLDFHLAATLERWRSVHGASVPDWLAAVGEWEALAALATLAHDHPDWSFPDFVPVPPELSAKALGHPLLPPDSCIRNDVSLGPAGTFLFVTGSNMSGKSTLLRGIGVNAVLAGAGSPVCADSMRVTPVRVRTSMRVEDSLAEGISLFMAELLRIKGVVDAADRADAGRPVLYLLDEILHGTNTAERQVAARGVVRHLLEAGAIGAVSTHDLELADAPKLAAAARPVHFTEQVEPRPRDRPLLTFDYRLRPGVATTRNALALLAAVGLGALAPGEASADGGGASDV